MPSWNEGFFCFFFIGKSLSPLALEPETSHKPSASLYHVSQASKGQGLSVVTICKKDQHQHTRGGASQHHPYGEC